MGRGHVFGVEVQADVDIDVLVPGPGPGRTPIVPITTTSPVEVRRAWPTAGSVRLIDRRHADGEALLRVDRHPEAGWRIEAPGHGVHHLARDGSALVSAPDPRAADHHLLVSQVLPMLAAVNGFSCLHAAGVVVDGAAVGILGPSGIGKTTLSACLASRGAAFLADDVLAVALGGGEAWAQAGARSRRVAGTGPLRAAAKSESLVSSGAGESALRTLVWLERAGPDGALSIDRLRPDVGHLLGAAFLPHLDEPAMLLAVLDVAAHLVQHAAALRAWVPEGADIRQVADALLEAVA